MIRRHVFGLGLPVVMSTAVAWQLRRSDLRFRGTRVVTSMSTSGQNGQGAQHMQLLNHATINPNTSTLSFSIRGGCVGMGCWAASGAVSDRLA